VHCHWSDNLKGRNHFKDESIDVRIILKCYNNVTLNLVHYVRYLYLIRVTVGDLNVIPSSGECFSPYYQIFMT
jgi:hypothetical protein